MSSGEYDKTIAREIVASAQDMRDAMRNLERLWLSAGDAGVTADALLQLDSYPFSESFDNLMCSVSGYVYDVECIAQRIAEVTRND